MNECDTYKYHLRQNGKVVHSGATYDIARREVEHQEEFPGSRIEQVGPKVTREEAIKWQRRQKRG